MSNNRNTSSDELCHLSWFIVEMDEGQVKEGKSNGRKFNEIIHYMDFIDDDPTNKYIEDYVKFNSNYGTIEGRVVVASDDRRFIEQHYKQLLASRQQAITDNNLTKLHLVLYEKENSSFTLAILHQNEIKWPNNEIKTEANKDKPTDILILDGKAYRRAKLLFIHHSDELMQKQFNALKEIFFNTACRNPHNNVNIKENCWLLVQYSRGLHRLMYSIVSDKETIWEFKNRYPDVITYITVNDVIYQAVILRKSLDRNELEKELNLLSEYSSNTTFPLANTITTKFKLPSLCRNGLTPPHSPSISPANSDDI